MNKPSIKELEDILNSNKELDIQINPDGSICAVDKGTAVNVTPKVLTFKEAIPCGY